MDRIDFTILEWISWGVRFFTGLKIRMGIPESTLSSKISVLIRDGYIRKSERPERHLTEEGIYRQDYPYELTEAGRCAVKLGWEQFQRLAEMRKWTVLPEETAPPELVELARREARVGQRRRLKKGIIIDPPDLPVWAKAIISILAGVGIGSIAYKLTKSEFWGLTTGFFGAIGCSQALEA
jgi:DNA-binding HxlR family transcriptional regulator